MRLLLALAFALVAPLAFIAPAHADLTKAQVEDIVAKYIAENGDKLVESITTAQQQKQQQMVKAIIRPGNPVLGPATAPVTIIEFSDFECPFCHKVQETVNQLRQRYGNRIRWVYKHYPLDFHPKAPPAAYASHAAHQQGKFWEFSKQVWARQNYLSDDLYTDVAKNLKLDMAKFNADRASAAAKKLVEADMADGAKVGVRGTPFFLVNGQALSGAQPIEAFTQVIEAELAKAEKKK
jgi:protein-disulfide isomerase